MELRNQGFLQLLLRIVLPIVCSFLIFLYGLGTTFLWSFSLFVLGIYFTARVFDRLQYSTKFLKKLDRINFFKHPNRLAQFIVAVIVGIGLVITALSYFISAAFCISLFGAYTTFMWVSFRLLSSQILIYTRCLQTDNFNAAYWYFNAFQYKVKRYSKSKSKFRWKRLTNAIANGELVFFPPKRPTSKQQIQTLDLLFKKKYYHSLFRIQQNLFYAFERNLLSVEVKKHILDSISKTYEQDNNLFELLLFSLHRDIARQNRNSAYHIFANPPFMLYWLELATQHPKQLELLQHFISTLGEQFAQYIADPRPFYFNYPIEARIKKSDLEGLSNAVLEEVPASLPETLKEELQYAYNLLLLTQGILRNLE